MDLKWLLISRIALVALVCLLVGAAVAVLGTSRDAMHRNAEIADLVSRQLNLQLSRIERATDVPQRFPDWDQIAGYSLQPGQCVELRGATTSMQPPRSACTGIDVAALRAPHWFQWLYALLTKGRQTATQTIVFQGQARASVIVDQSPLATAEKAWTTIMPLLGFSAALVSILCLISYVVINRALQPTKEIISGLDRLARGELACKLPSFQQAEFNRISEVFNELAEDLNKATSERAELARRLVDSQENERRHIARELHDDIAQKLSALSAHAACLRTIAHTDAPGIRDDAGELERMATDLMVCVRRTLTYLRPQEIDDLGLINSLRELVARHNDSARGNTSYTIQMTGDLGQLKAETNAHVYRIVQEALTNASKHANARHVEVKINRLDDADPETIRLSVIDDGSGPTFEAPPHVGPGAGIIGMRERVVALSGKFAAGPLPEGGFGLQVEFPTFSRRT